MPKLLDEAMERAWQKRDKWAGMGTAAARRIRELVPAEPVRVFATKLLSLLD